MIKSLFRRNKNNRKDSVENTNQQVIEDTKLTSVEEVTGDEYMKMKDIFLK